MKKLTVVAALIFACAISFGQKQNPTIVFDEKTYDFGEILAGSGPAEHVFTFTNVGDEPLIISNCKASCGCTVPKWTKDPVMPGQKGSINVTFTSTKVASPKAFSKSITVTSNGNPNTMLLTIKGHVVSVLTPASKAVISNSSIDLGEYNKKNVSTSFEISNEGTADLVIKNIEAPDFIKVTPKCSTIVAGSKTEVNVVVHTKGLDKINENIVITTDSEKTPTLTVNVLGNRK
ncbi:MAG: DUF1573 domain-containing protein [Bacteroidales bacterium]|jgi:hypothetical protein|nr:DUF1573 domain-containing protein [Bacteroidales bacterium]